MSRRESPVGRARAISPARMPLIAGLLLDRRPSAIAGFVVAVIVDAVDRMLRRRSAAHVGDERFVGLAPLSADSNASPTVVPEAGIFRVVTALLHCRPTTVFRCYATVGRVAVRHVVRLRRALGDFAAQTSTAPRVLSSVKQAARRQDAFRAAVAQAAPHRELVVDRRPFNNDQSPEASSAEIDNAHYVCNSTAFGVH